MHGAMIKFVKIYIYIYVYIYIAQVCQLIMLNASFNTMHTYKFS